MAEVNTRKRGTKWEYYFESAKVDGKRKRISKGGFDRKGDAYEAGVKALNEYNNAGQHFTPSELSFSDYLDYWMKEYCIVNLQDTTVTNYEKKIRLHIKPELGAYKLKALSPSVLQSFINKKFNEGYSRNTMAVLKGILSGSLGYAVEPLRFIQISPMYAVKLPAPRAESKVPTRKKDKKPITKEQWDEIIKRFPVGHSCHVPLLLAYHCGLRLGEAFALTWDDIDFENNTIDINKQVQNIDKKWVFTNPKYDSFRKIKADSILMEVLIKEKIKQERAKEYYAVHYQKIYIPDKRSSEYRKLDDSQPIWMVNSREDGSYIQPRVTQHLGRIIHYQLGYKDFDYHSLRTTHTTMLLEAGANPKAVQIRLGHKNIETTMNIYAKCTKKMENDTIDILEDILNKNNTPE